MRLLTEVEAATFGGDGSRRSPSRRARTMLDVRLAVEEQFVSIQDAGRRTGCLDRWVFAPTSMTFASTFRAHTSSADGDDDFDGY